MSAHKKLAIPVLLLMIAPIVLAACGPTSAPIIQTLVVEQTRIVAGTPVVETVQVEVTGPPPNETPIPNAKPGPYRIALFEDPVSLNYWSYVGSGSSVWTGYVLAGAAPSLYSLADVTFQFVPYLAAEMVEPVDNGDGTWSVTIPLEKEARWSDGQPITANDFVFTFQTCVDLKLTQNWAQSCHPNGLEARAEAVDDHTVKITFLNQKPSLGNWQAGVALFPILPQHFWKDTVAQAYKFVEDVKEPGVEHPADCTLEELSAEEKSACKQWAPVDEAYKNARKTLYEADATGAPSGGGYVTDKLEPGAFAQRTANNEWVLSGAQIQEYDDGTWMMTLPDGTSRQLYGEAKGNKTLDFKEGPYAPNIIFSIYGSQDAAFLALADGEVDYVLNPLGLPKGLRAQATKGEGVRVYTNPDYGMYYLAFNLRKYPMSEYEFRQAVDIILDKEFVADKVLGGVVYPMYSTMPPGNKFWYNPDVPTPYVGWTREQRVNEAVKVLREAGWRWQKEPTWNASTQQVDPGVGIKMPDGKPMPKLTILGPGPAYDPLRATFNQWISEWMRELGMPVESELTGFNTILGRVFADASFDMYILGWGLGNVAFPEYYEAFWASWNDTAVSGNNNTPGFNNADYDALVKQFMSTADLEEARDLVFKMQLLLADQRPYICLYYKQTVDLARDTLIFPYTETLGGLELRAGLQTSTIPVSR
jgi:peptide/nickel transport system substrate-binding protein